LGTASLIGFIEVEPTVRTPRENGERDVEFVMEVPSSAEGLDQVVVRLDGQGLGVATYLRP
jgi:hypothetical protein